VAPYEKIVNEMDKYKNKGKKKQQTKEPSKLWNSSMEEDSSEEDFEYLQQYLEEHKTLPPGSMRLLRNVVSVEY